MTSPNHPPGPPTEPARDQRYWCSRCRAQVSVALAATPRPAGGWPQCCGRPMCFYVVGGPGAGAAHDLVTWVPE